MSASPYPLVEVGAAQQLVLAGCAVLPAEEVELLAAHGRVLAESVCAPESLPRWRVSAVDGYAMQPCAAGTALSLAGESAAGRPFDGAIGDGEAVRILTGGVVPAGAGAVVMQEDTEAAGGRVLTHVDVRAGANIHEPGADIRGGEVALESGSVLGPAELGLAGSLGLARLRVHRRPSVALLSTGDELVPVGAQAGMGQIPDSNSVALAAALAEAGADVRSLGVAPDEPDALRRLVVDALRSADALVTSGGVSVGTHDLVKPLLESLGEVHIGRVSLRPGKPFTFATLPEGRVAFGLPGFPVSSLVTFEVFVRPALRKMQGHQQVQRPALPVRLGFEARPGPDRTEYHRVRLQRDGDELVALSTGSQSSSRLLSLVGADALVRVPPGEHPLAPGTRVEAIILRLP